MGGDEPLTIGLVAHERRVTGTFHHPIFDYVVMWRRAIEDPGTACPWRARRDAAPVSGDTGTMTFSDGHSYLVAYDIVGTRRRDRVAKRLQAYGDRVQYSVFWVRASPARLIRLQASVASLLNRQEGSLLICDLGPANADVSGRVTVLGRSLLSTEEDRFIV